MQIPNMNRYLLSIYVESVLKFFKYFESLGVWSLGVQVFGVLILIVKSILDSFRVNRHSYSF